MLDRKAVAEFLLKELKNGGSRIPKDVSRAELVEAFCKFVEDDYYGWLKDNFASFFNHGNPDWDWIKEYIKGHKIKTP